MTHRVFIALLHWPVCDRKGRTVATALTTIDVH
ncbi:MAG: RNA methyltransferase, partial [Deltaproteobacteria bacterium]